MRDFHLERITWYCCECKQTSKFMWIIDGFICVGNANENPPREGCGHKLRLKDFMDGERPVPAVKGPQKEKLDECE